MRCPNCGVEAPAGATECAGCGVIFAKFSAKKERTTLEAKLDPVVEDKPVSFPRVDPWKARAVAAGLVAFWFCAFGLYYRHAVAVVRARGVKVEVKDRPFVMMRDPETGAMRQIPVIIAPVIPRKPAEPAAP